MSGRIHTPQQAVHRCIDEPKPSQKTTRLQCLHVQPVSLSVSADINECEAGDPCPGQQCANTEGSYSCVSCQQGYQTVNGKCAGERARTCAGKIQPHPKHFFLVHFQTMLDLKIDSDETTDVQHILRPYLL